MQFKVSDVVPYYKKKIGIIHKDWRNSDCAYWALNSTNSIVDKTNIDITLFYEDLPDFVIPPATGSMNFHDIWGFDGLTIATNLDQANALSKVVGNHPKIFYVWDLEFLKDGKRNFLYNVNIYRNPRLKLVTRSEDHAKCLSNYCNRKVDSIIENFDLFKFWETYNE